MVLQQVEENLEKAPPECVLKAEPRVLEPLRSLNPQAPPEMEKAWKSSWKIQAAPPEQKNVAKA